MVKKIHYCWFGSPIPQNVRRQVEDWKILCPDYELKEWNHANVLPDEYSQYPYWNRVYERKKWAFVSDFIQFKKVYEEGGFYLDCDVRMVKSLDEINFSPDHLLLGYMYDGVISGGFMYAPPKHPLVKRILEYYAQIKEDCDVVNNTILTDCLNDYVDDLLLNGRFYTSDKYKLTLYPKEYFCQPSFISSKSFLLDQFAGSWKNKGCDFISERKERNFVGILRRKIRCFFSIMNNEFCKCYLMALLGIKWRRRSSWRRNASI